MGLCYRGKPLRKKVEIFARCELLPNRRIN